MRAFVSACVAGMFVLAMPGASAAGDPAQPPAMASKRFPQPVRTGDLPGRLLIQPKESQPILGHVVSAVRQADGSPALVIRLSGWMRLDLFGTRDVLVATDVLALMGEHVAAIEIKPETLEGLDTYASGSLSEIPADETLVMAIVGPFHGK